MWQQLRTNEAVDNNSKCGGKVALGFPLSGASLLHGYCCFCEPMLPLTFSTPNNVFSARHKCSKRGVGMGPINNSGFLPQQPAETPLSAADKLVAAAAAEAPPDSSPRDPPHQKNNWEVGPRSPANQQFHVGTEPPRVVFRRGNAGPRGGGDSHYHGGYGNRRDHERTNYEWNGREVHVRQPRVLPKNFIQPPAPATAPPPFVAPPPIRPYGGPMGFPDLPAPQYYIPVLLPESVRSGSFVAHPGPPPPMFYTPPAAQLQTILIKQIDYYFSAENLCKDLFLQRHMDE